MIFFNKGTEGNTRSLQYYIMLTTFCIIWKLIANQFNSNETICLSFYASKRLFGQNLDF